MLVVSAPGPAEREDAAETCAFAPVAGVECCVADVAVDAGEVSTLTLCELGANAIDGWLALEAGREAPSVPVQVG